MKTNEKTFLILVPTWVLGSLGPSWGRLGASWVRLGGIFGASWAVLGTSWGVLGGILGRVGASWERLGGALDVSWGIWKHVRHVQEASQSRLDLQNQPKRHKATLNGSLRCSFVVPIETNC